jgi:hypothetical protein
LKDGKTYYSIQGLAADWPSSLAYGALYERCYVVAYKSAVLSVIMERDYDSSRSFEELKAAVSEALPALAGRDDTKGLKAMNSVFSYELRLALSRFYGLWSSVTDKVNGTFRLEVEHIDLTNLSYYWMAGGQ